MAEPLPVYAQRAYAVLRAKFNSIEFDADYLGWYVSADMVKKTLHELERAGWIARAGRGRYRCVPPEEVFKSMIEYRVPHLLDVSGMRYAYADASAAEVWTDYTYMQRSWEHSPYSIDILRPDLPGWIKYLRSHRVKVFIGKAKAALGEFVILKPKKTLIFDKHDGVNVEPLQDVTKYCEEHIDAFEYHAAYLREKFKAKTSAKIDKRVVEEARQVA